jgi:hypothetical protein
VLLLHHFLGRSCLFPTDEGRCGAPSHLNALLSSSISHSCGEMLESDTAMCLLFIVRLCMKEQQSFLCCH